MKKLPRSFYLQTDVVELAQSLIGKRLVTRINGKLTAGIITETEAYAGTTDRASHAYNGRRTQRTEVMYMKGGTAYVYLCYGIHSLFNVVTNRKDIPHAVLVRAIEPVTGIPHMLQRRNQQALSPRLTCGPGSLASALGISTLHSGSDLLTGPISIEGPPNGQPQNILVSRRVGIDYAGPDAPNPWRFLMGDSDWISQPA